MNAIEYKGFYIVVKVQYDGTTRNRFRVESHIYRNPERTPPVMRSWLALQEFASNKAAYEFGLQQARAWIDEDEKSV